MSRIGRAPITVPSGVEFSIDGRQVRVTGPRGALALEVGGEITVRRDGEEIVVGHASRVLGRPVKWIDQVLELALTHTPTPLSEAEVEEDLALAEEKAQKGSERPSTH